MKNFIEKLRNIDLVKILIGIVILGISAIVIYFFFSVPWRRPKMPGHIVCYSQSGIVVLDTWSPDVLWHNTSGVTYLNVENQEVQFSNENCMVTSDHQP